MFGFGGCVPVDKESVKVIAAMQYLHMREEEEVAKARGPYKEGQSRDEEVARGKRVAEVHSRFKQKEIALLRRAAGPLAKIIDGK